MIRRLWCSCCNTRHFPKTKTDHFLRKERFMPSGTISQSDEQRAARLNNTMAGIRLEVQYARTEFWHYETDYSLTDVLDLSHRAAKICHEIEFLRRQLTSSVSVTGAANFVAAARLVVERAIKLWRQNAHACDTHGFGGADHARDIADNLSAILRDELLCEGEAEQW
jgi:hypothetical protein